MVILTAITLAIFSGKFSGVKFSIKPTENQQFYQDEKRVIKAVDYRQFWRWPNSAMPANLKIERLYFLHSAWTAKQGWVDYQHYPIKLKNIDSAVLTYRLERLADANLLMPKINADIDRWQSLGNNIIGIQFDFDSGTSALIGYAEFLKASRKLLPKEMILSATGLMDWGNAEAYDIKLLSQTVDELIFQTYQGSETLPDLNAYFKKILSNQIPFKIGLLANSVIQPKDFSEVMDSSYFNGYVVFLSK